MIIEISPSLKGYFTYSDLLTNEGTIFFKIDKIELLKEGYFFQIVSEDFHFKFESRNHQLILTRNEGEAILSLESIPDKSVIIIIIMWSYTELSLKCNFENNKGDILNEKVNTLLTNPPINLLRYARKENLIPTKEYANIEEFRNKIHSCFLTVNQKISESGNYYSFWNTVGENKTKNRKPKNETEVQPLIHSLLSDQMFLSSIEVIPEYKSGVGSLDFLFIGQVKDLGSVYFCAEFKRGHSNKLKEGLTNQLPAYMIEKNAEYGAYCILNYYGDWLPPSKKMDEVEFDLNNEQLKDPRLEKIRIFNFKLAKPPTASKL